MATTLATDTMDTTTMDESYPHTQSFSHSHSHSPTTPAVASAFTHPQAHSHSNSQSLPHSQSQSHPPSHSHSTTSSLSLSISSSQSTLLDDQDEDVRIAVRALGDMRNASLGHAQSQSQYQGGYYQQQQHHEHAMRTASWAAGPGGVVEDGFDHQHEYDQDPSAKDPALALAQGQGQGGFASRVHALPLVNSALRAYEVGKNSSRVVKYGASIMESSISSLSRSRPLNGVIDSLPVARLDDLACRVVDRIDKYRNPTPQPTPDDDHDVAMDKSDPDKDRWMNNSPTSSPCYACYDDAFSPTSTAAVSASTSPLIKSKSILSPSESLSSLSPSRRSPPPPEPLSAGTKRRKMEKEGGRREKSAGPGPERGEKSTRAHRRHRSSGSTGRNHHHHSRNTSANAPPPPPLPTSPAVLGSSNGEDTQLALTPRPTTTTTTTSRWHNATSALLSEAGGLSAAISEESMRRLRFCLGWLMYATSHIDAQILQLRDFTESLKGSVSTSTPSGESPTTPTPASVSARGNTAADPQIPQSPASPTITPAQAARLNALRQDIVNTVRQVVDVVSKYAGGGSDSESDAKDGEKGGLKKEERMRVKGFILRLPGKWREAVAGATPPPNAQGQSPTQTQPGQLRGPPSPTTALLAAQRILALATESLDMMRGVTGVVKDSLDRAEAWMGRFESVGMGRRVTAATASETDPQTGEQAAAQALRGRGLRNGPTEDSEIDSEYDYGSRRGSVTESEFGFRAPLPQSAPGSTPFSRSGPPSASTSGIASPLSASYTNLSSLGGNSMPVDAPSPAGYVSGIGSEMRKMSLAEGIQQEEMQDQSGDKATMDVDGET